MSYSNVFRPLRSDEIECRVAQSGIKDDRAWASYLLYKDARVDQRIMDETFGPMNWGCNYEMIDGKMFCTVSVWDSEKRCWVSKKNVGTESNTEKEKGHASDCLKRACFTWGLGVELYSSPKIFITLNPNEYKLENGRVHPTLQLTVREIDYNETRKVNHLVLVDKSGRVRFEFNSGDVYRDAQGGEMMIGDHKWRKAVLKTAAGEVCNDGTPIPVWLSDTYNLPDSVMEKFTAEVKKQKEKNGNS